MGWPGRGSASVPAPAGLCCPPGPGREAGPRGGHSGAGAGVPSAPRASPLSRLPSGHTEKELLVQIVTLLTQKASPSRVPSSLCVTTGHWSWPGESGPARPASPPRPSWPHRLLHSRAVTHLMPLFFLFLPLLLFLCRLFPRAHPKPPNTIRTEGVRGRDERKGFTGSGDERLLPEPPCALDLWREALSAPSTPRVHLL